jgi:hypothetical protein
MFKARPIKRVLDGGLVSAAILGQKFLADQHINLVIMQQYTDTIEAITASCSMHTHALSRGTALWS